MNEYIELLKLFKVANQNIQILHRNLIGANWFGDHEQLGEYYEHVQNDIDAFCETGISKKHCNFAAVTTKKHDYARKLFLS